jgi:hypothetical protein
MAGKPFRSADYAATIFKTTELFVSERAVVQNPGIDTGPRARDGLPSPLMSGKEPGSGAPIGPAETGLVVR